MPTVLALALGLIVAAVTGIGSAWLAVEEGRIFGAVRAGNWIAWPDAGGPDADPYALAHLARTGETPLGAGEGIAFAATVDDEGAPMTGNCVYHVVGETPAARLWTLTAYDETGRLTANPALRTGFYSGEILRSTDGSFTIVVSSEVAPGNWLPVAAPDAFNLVLRLYDTPVTSGTQIGGLTMPSIQKVGCR